MVEGALNKCAKYLLFVFNVVFVLLAIVLIAIGAVVQSSVAGPLHVAIFIIVIGGIIFIVAFFGCCGAINEVQCMLITYGGLLVIILLLCAIGAIIGFVYKNKTGEIAHDLLETYIKEYNKSDTVKKSVDNFQKQYNCCGISNYTDWRDNPKFNRTNSVPDSCCKTVTQDCGARGLLHPSDINTKGCITFVQGQLEKGYKIVGAVTAVVAVVMIVGIILACCLAQGIRRGYNTV